MAEASAEIGDIDRSNTLFDQAISLDTDLVKPYKSWAWVLFLHSNFDKALEVLQACLGRGRNSGDLQYLLARTWQAKNEPSKAKLCYESALSFCPGSYIYWTSAGILYAENTQYTDSFQCFAKAITLCGDSVELWNNVDMLYKLCGQKAEADLAFQRACQFNTAGIVLSSSFLHPGFGPGEAIHRLPKEGLRRSPPAELLQQLERCITREVLRLLETLKKTSESAEGREEKKAEIVVPKVATPVAKAEGGPLGGDQRVNNAHVAMLQNLMMNPMMFYQIMMNTAMANRAQAAQVPAKEEVDGEQEAKTLIEMTGESIRKKRKNTGDSDEPKKKPKEGEE